MKNQKKLTSPENEGKEAFNPQFSVDKKGFNTNQLSARSCMCHPSRC